MTDLKNNPHFQNGVYKGTQVVKNIENTTYGTIEVALERKRELVEDLKKQFGWGESQKDVAETLGIISALEQEQLIRKANEPDIIIQISDIMRVSEDIGITISSEQAEQALERYPDAQENDPSGTWNLVVEQLIHEVNNEKL